MIATATPLLVVERKQWLTGRTEDNNHDIGSLNSFFVFPNPCKLSQAETQSVYKGGKSRTKKERLCGT